MQVKLLRTQDQAKSLLVAMEWFNIVCDAIAEVAHARRCANKLEL